MFAALKKLMQKPGKGLAASSNASQQEWDKFFEETMVEEEAGRTRSPRPSLIERNVIEPAKKTATSLLVTVASIAVVSTLVVLSVVGLVTLFDANQTATYHASVPSNSSSSLPAWESVRAERSQSAGEIRVNEYTRQDGTKVESKSIDRPAEVQVRAYTRKDGTPVRAYSRSK